MITVLPGTPELQELMTGHTSRLTALAAGSMWIDVTSGSPQAVRPIQDAARARGVEVLEAPMGGGPQAAAAGTLHLYAGGETTTSVVIRTGGRHHEAMLLGHAAGLENEALRALLADRAAGSEFLRHDMRRVLVGDHLPRFGLRCTENSKQ